MIHAALTYICDLLNENFKNEFSITENKVVLSNIVNPDGSVAKDTEGKMTFFLLNLEEESTLKNNLNRSSNRKGNFEQKNPSLHLNMQLIFCSNFVGKNYSEGLRYLSTLIRFFQNNKKLAMSSPSNNLKNNRLMFEICKLNFSEISHIWSAIGSKIMPFVVYRVRILTMDDTTVTKIIPAIKKPIKK